MLRHAFYPKGAPSWSVYSKERVGYKLYRITRDDVTEEHDFGELGQDMCRVSPGGFAHFHALKAPTTGETVFDTMTLYTLAEGGVGSRDITLSGRLTR